MSISLMTAAWKAQISCTRKIVLLALCDIANDQGECYPSIQTIAARCSLKERVVYDCLRELDRDGYLSRITRAGRSTVYQIMDPCTWRTPASHAPLHDMQPTPAPDAGVTPALGAYPPASHAPPPAPDAGTPASHAPITITKASLNHHRTEEVGAERKAPDPQPPAPPHVVSLPLNDGSEFGITETLVAEWSATYPAVDVVQQLRQMRQWCIANPARRKTRRGVLAFAVNWLGKEQNSGQKPQQYPTRKSIHDERAETLAALTGRDRTALTGRIIDIPQNDSGGVD